MELIQYIRLIRRWLWLLILAGFVGGSIAFINQIRQPLTYSAQTLISIGGFMQSPNPSGSTIGISMELTETYAQIVRTHDVLEATVNALGNPVSADQLNGMLYTYILPDTALMQLSVTYTDPILCADLVNELANQLILASPSNLTPEQRNQITLLNEQIASLTGEISNLRERQSALDIQLATDDLTSARRVELQVERLTLIEQINSASNTVAQFAGTVAELQVRTNSVEVVEQARIPESPISQISMSTLMIGAITAATLVFGLALFYEYLNSTFHSTDEVLEILRKPILGTISRYGKKSESYPDKLLTNKMNTRVPDEYRILRTNLLFSSDLTRGIYVVTSAMPSEGKSTVISNLAISLAMSGLHVLLIDADLRKPRIHEIFSLDNDIGLTSLLTASLSQSSILSSPSKDGNSNGMNKDLISPTWQEAIQAPTGIENLWILCSGSAVENPTELLGSTIMKNWIDNIQDNLNFDVILIDTPPLLGFPDSAVMSVSLDAKVIPVIKANSTRHESAKRMIERLTQVQAQMVGIILNQSNPKEENYQGYNYYIDYYTRST